MSDMKRYTSDLATSYDDDTPLEFKSVMVPSFDGEYVLYEDANDKIIELTLQNKDLKEQLEISQRYQDQMKDLATSQLDQVKTLTEFIEKLQHKNEELEKRLDALKQVRETEFEDGSRRIAELEAENLDLAMQMQDAVPISQCNIDIAKAENLARLIYAERVQELEDVVRYLIHRKLISAHNMATIEISMDKWKEFDKLLR